MKGLSLVWDLKWRARCSAFLNDWEQTEQIRSSCEVLRERRRPRLNEEAMV